MQENGGPKAQEPSGQVKTLDHSTTRPLDHSFQVELLTPEGALLSDRAEEVIAPGSEGYFGVRAGHAFFVTSLKAGVLTVKRQDKHRCYKVSGGVVQVTPEKVVVCAESASLTDVEHR